MSKLLTEFPKPTFEEWKSKLVKDLKGEPASLLESNNAIEEIEVSSYQHQEITDKLPDFRFLKKGMNEWYNFGNIQIINDIEANKIALNLLELGADALRFECDNGLINFGNLLKGIEYKFIHTRFVFKTIAQVSSFQNHFSQEDQQHFSLELDALEQIELIDLLKEKINISIPCFNINGFAIQQLGANCSQELAGSLSIAHHYLVGLLQLGYSTNEANHLIHFNVGVGNNYFFEIAKVTVLRQLWNSILVNYNDSHVFSQNIQITGIVGHLNKSLKDPYTNLLRQTTEAMSLLSAGVDSIIVLPYDAKSTAGISELSQRMSINIPTILKEESYFHAVQQPVDGSYTLKTLEHEIATKAWSIFQELESKDGMFNENCQAHFKSQISKKAKERIEQLIDKTMQLIGINIFPNPETVSNSWSTNSTYLGMEQLILEQHK